MYKIILFLLINLPLVNFGQGEKKYVIDMWESKCLEDSLTTSGMRHCTNTAHDKWDVELNKYYNLLMKSDSLNEDQKVVLKESQREWIQYRDKEFEFISDYYFEIKTGTMWHPESDNRKLQLTRTRTIELMNYYKILGY